MKYKFGSDKNPSGLMKVYARRPGFAEPYSMNSYDDMEVTSVTFTTTHEAIKQILPPPLEPASDILRWLPPFSCMRPSFEPGMERIVRTGSWACGCHGEQKFKFHRPFPPAANVFNNSRVAEVYDRGEGKGCVLELDGIVRLPGGEPVVSWQSRIVALGDRCIGSHNRVPRPHAIPDRQPDFLGVTETRCEQALLYRLTGDRNLVHVDPRVARKAGFPRPILHGACTASIACREIVKQVCKYDQSRVEEFDVRWTSPAFPGERIETSMWLDDGVVSFRCRSVERDKIVIDNGRCKLRDERP